MSLSETSSGLAQLPEGLIEQFDVLGVLGRREMALRSGAVEDVVTVLLLRDKQSGMLIAGKLTVNEQEALKLAGIELSAIARFQDEFKIPNIVGRIPERCGLIAKQAGVGQFYANWLIALEYCSGGDLEREIQSWNGRLHLNLVGLLTRAKQLLEALTAMHRENWAHRDICARNVAIDAGGNWRLSDFALASTRFNSGAPIVQAGGYAAPELRRNDPQIDFAAADVYSSAVVLTEVASAHPLVEHKSNQHIFQVHEPALIALSPAFTDLLRWMLHADPKRRWTAAQCLARVNELLLRASQPQLPQEDRLDLSASSSAAPSPFSPSQEKKQISTTPPRVTRFGGFNLDGTPKQDQFSFASASAEAGSANPAIPFARSAAPVAASAPMDTTPVSRKRTAQEAGLRDRSPERAPVPAAQLMKLDDFVQGCFTSLKGFGFFAPGQRNSELLF